MSAVRVVQDAAAPLENRTLRQQVADHLRKEILEGQLAPGTELGEATLAASLDMSRGPLREAFGQLAAEELVTIVPRQGAIVRRLTRQEFIDAYQVREALESLAIRLGVPRLTDQERTTLHEMCDEMERRCRHGDSDDFFGINREFHDLLVRASGNRELVAVHAQLIAQMGRLMKQSVAASRRPRALGGRAPRDPRRDRRRRRAGGGEPARGAHRGAAASAPLTRGRVADVRGSSN